MQVAKWGDGLGARLPMALIRQLGISACDVLTALPVTTQSGKAALEISRVPSKFERIQSMRKYRIAPTENLKFSRYEANLR